MISLAVLGLLLCSEPSNAPIAPTTPTSPHSSVPTAGEAKGAFVDLEFNAARALAQKEGKLLMVDFFTTWCGPCKKLDAVTWPDAKVQRWLLENVVAIKVDAEQDERTRSLYEVDFYPSLVFMTSDGLELDRLAGFLAPEQFLGAARMLVAAAQDGNALAQRATGPENLVPQTRLAYANYLAGNKRYRDAAQHYLWCFDEGSKHDESFSTTRRTEVLDNFSSLSRHYIRGKRELTARRDAALARLLSEEGTLADALDLSALDAVLKRKSDTLETYMTLVARDDDASRLKATGLLDTIFENLIGPKRYADIGKCKPDFNAQLDRSLEELQALRSKFESVARAKSMLDAERSAIVTRGTLHFEVLLAIEQAEAAEALAKRLAELDPTARTFLALARRAKRMGDRETALRWANRGLESVPEEQRGSLDVMRKSLERELKNANR